jgi:hypothetical protein
MTGFVLKYNPGNPDFVVRKHLAIKILGLINKPSFHKISFEGSESCIFKKLEILRRVQDDKKRFKNGWVAI